MFVYELKNLDSFRTDGRVFGARSVLAEMVSPLTNLCFTVSVRNYYSTKILAKKYNYFLKIND
jgi:hypothetical protein